VSVLGKAYLGFFLAMFVVGIAWGSTTLQSNASLVEIVLAVPSIDMIEPVRRIRYEVNLAWLMAGWVVAGAIVVLGAMRAPFRIRGAAVVQKRLRELEREVKELRTLPLRQQAYDDDLAAEAQLDLPTRKVMTEQMRRQEKADKAERAERRADAAAARRQSR
jgi:hypothetical protein